MKVQGACHCGQITYEADVDPEKVGLCSCSDCQVLSGSAYRVSATVPASSFLLLTGTPKVYVKTAESGKRRRQSFCGHCGTSISSSADSDAPPSYTLRIGPMAQRALLPPRRRVWCRSALAWSEDLRGLPAFDKGAP
ncbi:GFA family protein [Variovorax sp. Root411]|uniref:GFA family protein n=1 Tax=Variovorax sp. Root411 TaxID=1736530 RepID=UPI0006F5E801|nr:GFA family protein [Variovorax sp. Root411]KQW57433.1 aldehyde-activating protein [Variovorax sp. Root411]